MPVPSTQPAKRALAAFGVAMTAALAACGGDETAGSNGAGAQGGSGGSSCTGMTIAYAAPIPIGAVQYISDTIKSDVEAEGFSFRGTNAQNNPGKQASDIDTLVQQSADAIIIDPTSVQALTPALRRAERKGVAIVMFDPTPAPTVPVTTIVRSRFREASSAGADYLAEKLGNKPVAAIFGPPFPPIVPRNEGFAENAPKVGLDIVDRQTISKVTPDGGAAAAAQLSDRYGGRLAGLWVVQDSTAIGVASAIRGDFRPLVVTTNGSPEIVGAIKAKKITATFDTVTPAVAHVLAWAGMRAACKQSPPKEVFVGTKPVLVDETNAARWRSWQELAKTPLDIEPVRSNGQLSVPIPDSYVFSGS